jgi:probable F420-dependent oxidoreductase
MARKKFRFGIQTSRASTGDSWRDKARKIEDLGFSTLFMPDHFADQFAPTPALMAAADATTTLRVGGLVLDVDYRHPLVLAKEVATMDVLSGGRVEFGFGAGWMISDYEQAGMTYDSPGVRISRMKEALRIIKSLWTAEGPVSFSGEHYTLTDAIGFPKPAQQPHPPVMIGGGGKRVLRLAAREADIISVNFSLAEGAVNQKTTATGSAAATREKLAWIREAAGDRFDDIELETTVFATVVTDDGEKMAERIAPGFGVSPAEVLEGPHALIGSVDQIVDDLQRRRDDFGFSYIVFSGDVFDQVAPIVKKLAGT